MSNEKRESLNFIEQIIEEDIKNGKHEGRIHTRFPPEPNGYLHIGHAKSICLNFGIAQKYGGKVNLRFDDTNPVAEDIEYVNSIKKDIQWLGFEWEEDALYTSNYFDKLYAFAVELIKKGKAYVDDSSAEEVAQMKGTPTEAGTNSPYRERSVEENLDLFERMKAGEFDEGSKILRAKIDMTSPNMHLRDPFMYRIRKIHHHNTGDKWCIYPMYDFAHGLSDAIEGITHSLCTLEFEVHRPLYDWFLEELGTFRSRQIEFARLNLTYTIMSKRKLRKLVEGDFVAGWDDPRMPTVSGMRRRGFTATAIRNFAERVGIARRENLIDVGLLEYFVREDLNKITPRVMGVLNPLKVVITNYPDGKTEELTAINNPGDETQGSRIIPFSKEIYIEKEDFMIDAPRKFFRLSPGRNVRLKNAYIITCEDYKTDENGEVVEVYCKYYPESKSGEDTSGIKAKGVLHFVSIEHAVDVDIRLYDRLFSDENPSANKEKDFLELLNPNSLNLQTAKVEPSLLSAKAGDQFQFMRKGYFILDEDSTEDRLVFNRTITLKDPYKKKAQAKGGQKKKQNNNNRQKKKR
jgi:glutaminyl-tRNA synthetase